jgi:hypothetical protein
MAFLKRLWKAWQNVALIIANFVARLVLTLFYFTVFLPFGVGVTLFGDALKLKETNPPHWKARETLKETIEQAQRQF